MKSFVGMALLLSLLAPAFAERAETGKPFPAYTLVDPFGSNHTLRAETRLVVVASEKAVSTRVNEWLQGKSPDFLASNRIEYIADIEPMPVVISKLFALPKMRKFPFPILLATDKSFAATYPRQEGKIAVFMLDDRQVLVDIRYLDRAEEVEALLPVKVAP